MKRPILTADLKDFLDSKVALYNRPGFIVSDPISIPHRFTRKQDIEIAGLFTAVLAWGQRPTIINKCLELMTLMDEAPYDFLRNHRGSDLKRFGRFKHRTFNPTDTLYFIEFLSSYYRTNESLEEAFLAEPDAQTVAPGLIHFHRLFFSLEHPDRTQKHISTPERKSACKRLNMYLRWMVRKDNQGVDFGLWTRLRPSKLVCPCDVHVERVARKLGLMKSRQLNWDAAVELTDNLRKFDPIDPVKYDFALFGLGVEEKF